MDNTAFNNAVTLVARILLSLIFVFGGIQKVFNYAGAVAYMDKVGMPTSLLPLVLFTEICGGLLILSGLMTRYAAFVLAVFTLVAGVLVHLKAGDFGNMIHFWKNVAMTGGFVSLIASGAGGWSLDGLLNRGRISDQTV